MHFDGMAKRRTNVSLRGKSKEEEKADLLRRARKEREARAADKEKRNAASSILRFYQRRSSLSRIKSQARGEFDKRMADLSNLRTLLAAAKRQLPTPVAVMEGLVGQLVFFYDPSQDTSRLEKLASLLLDSCRSSNLEWDYRTLQGSQPQLFETEAIRLGRLCLQQISERRAGDDENPTLYLLLGLLEVLLELPSSSPDGSASSTADTTWRILLALGIEARGTSLPRIATSQYMASLRRDMGLPSALRKELQRLSDSSSSSSSSSTSSSSIRISRPLTVIWKLALTAAGLPQASGPISQAPASLKDMQSKAAGQVAMALLTSPKLVSDPVIAPLIAPLRQAKAQGLCRLIEAWDGLVESEPSTIENLGSTLMIVVYNLLELCRLLLEQGDLEASKIPSVIRILAFSVRKVPLAVASPSAWTAGGGDESMDVEEDYAGDNSGSGMLVEAKHENLDDAILNSMRANRANRVAQTPDEIVLAKSAQEALKGLCGGRELPCLFDRLFNNQNDAPRNDAENDSILMLCNLCSYVLVDSEESVPNGARSGGISGLMSQILNLLAYHSSGTPFVRRLWTYLEPKVSGRRPFSSDGRDPAANNILSTYHSALHLLFSVYSHQLMALDDEEFHSREFPIPLTQVTSMVETLKALLYQVYWIDPLRLGGPAGGGGGGGSMLCLPQLDYLQLTRSATNLFNQLYQRHTRRRLPPPADGSPVETLWHWPAITPHELDQETAGVDDEGMETGASIERILDTSKRLYPVLTRIPQVLPFAQRVQVFHKLLAADKRYAQDEAQLIGHRIRVRRDQIYEDAYAGMNHLGHGLRGRVQVTFVSDLGTEEAGIDGGGVFKEFMDALSKRAFDPQYAIFRVTPDHLLYPNPLSELASGSDHLNHFEFLGRVLAKALYESILVEPQFALFFLQRLAGKLNETDDLYSLDPELYRHIMSLKHMKSQGGNIADLALNFEVVTQDDMQQSKTSELIPGGRHVAVTNDNVFRYIQLVANYKLNVEINAQVQAFLRGFRDLIPTAWLRMFGAEELQLLLTGEKRAIDIENLRAHTRYTGGYHPSQPIIQWFWDALRSFTPDQQSQFLMFVTSCSRQPLLGFKHLNPPFCIQKVFTTEADGVRLPSSATCMNLLKMPAYATREMLREKLLYAVTAGAGFELS